MTVCKQPAVPLFRSKLRNYITVPTGWSVFCIAICCCLYCVHTAVCSYAAYWNCSSDWSVWGARPRGLLVLIYASLKTLLSLL